MRVIGVILAGGSGQRMQKDEPKQFLNIAGIPMIGWSAMTLTKVDEIETIVFVVPEKFKDRAISIKERLQLKKEIIVIAGGASRQESSYRAITSSICNNADIVVLHDAARPFVSQKIVINCINAAIEFGAAGVYAPVLDTITVIEDNLVKTIPPRNSLYVAQTPQAFKYSIIREAHEQSKEKEFSVTDDISMVISVGYPVHAVPGDYGNLKITTENDYLFACWFGEHAADFGSLK